MSALDLHPKSWSMVRPVSRRDIDGVLARPNVEAIMFCHSTVIDQAVPAIWLFLTGDKGDGPDLDPLRSGEKGHTEWVSLYRRDDGPPVEEHAGYPGLFCGYANSKTTGPGSNDEQVRCLHHPLFTVHCSLFTVHCSPFTLFTLQ